MSLHITNARTGKLCNHCYSKTPLVRQAISNDITSLPIWFDDNNQVQYHVPPELAYLREAEKLLISLVSVYIPIFHLSKGQIGCKGHVCCFEKDISQLCTVSVSYTHPDAADD